MEIKAVFEVEKLDEMIRKFPIETRLSMTAKVTSAALLLERVIKEKTPVGAGPIHLRDTIFQRIISSGDRVAAEIGTPAVHGVPVELGTKPHFPPIAPIQFWVERKLGISGDEAKSVAFLIARAISRRGTAGDHMFDKGFHEAEAQVAQILQSIPEDVIRRVTA